MGKPVLNLSLSADVLSAHLSIIPEDKDPDSLSRADIVELLAEKNIVTGIMEPVIKKSIDDFNRQKKRMVNILIAKGLYPTPGTKGKFNFSVPFIQSMVEIEALKKLSDIHIMDVLKITQRFKRVNPKDVIATRGALKVGDSGINLQGEKVPSLDLGDSGETLGPGVEYNADQTAVLANQTGIAIYENQQIYIIEVDFNGRATISISDDAMEAQINLLPPGHNGNALSIEDIGELLKEYNITHGIEEGTIEMSLEQVNNKKNPVENLIFARGTPAINGNDATLEYNFNTDGTLTPKANEDGSVDFKKVSLIETVEKGQQLANLIPSTEGESGMNVLGKTIPYIKGVPRKLPMGKNTLPSQDNPNALLADVNGNASLRNNMIEVSEGYMVNGDLDFSVGNIDYPKSVTITGDIKPGFQIICGGDLEIRGTAEDANLTSKGSILIRGGFIGGGSGIIQTGGNVNLGFIRNQTVRSKSSIIIAKEAINSKLYARDSITILGKTLSAVGGIIIARNQIEVKVSGNTSGTKTLLEVGQDFTLEEEKFRNEDKIRELDKNKSKVQINLSKFQKIIQVKKKLDPKHDFLYRKLKALLSKIDNQLGALQKRKEIIENKIKEESKCRIIIHKLAYSGSQFKIKDNFLVLKEDLQGPKTIMLVKGELKVL